jgi:hypothetical protein
MFGRFDPPIYPFINLSLPMPQPKSASQGSGEFTSRAVTAYMDRRLPCRVDGGGTSVAHYLSKGKAVAADAPLSDSGARQPDANAATHAATKE